MEEPKSRQERRGIEADDDDRGEVPIRECGSSLVATSESDPRCDIRESVIISKGRSSEISLKISAFDEDSCRDDSSLPSFTACHFDDSTAAGQQPLYPCHPVLTSSDPDPDPPLSPRVEFATTVETKEKLPVKIGTGLTVDICDKNSKCDQPSLYSAPKSPVTVQDWVDSIDLSNERTEVEPNEGGLGLGGSCTKDIVGGDAPHELEDNLGLGAEALHLQVKKTKEKDEQKSNISLSSDSLRKAFQLGRENSQSLNSETSTISISSVEAFLETMRDDPEEILANLGFGSPVSSPLARIPKRFLVPSQVKGNDLHDFIEKHEEMQELFDMGFSGYRGLSGICMDGHSPSGIVSKILEKIRDRNNELKRALTMTSSNTSAIAAANQPPTMSFYHAAFSVMAVNAFRNAIRPGSSNNSILEPENRQFLDSQDEMMSNRRKKRPRLVIGKHSFTVDTDEELIDDNEEDEGRNDKPRRTEVPNGTQRRHATKENEEATNHGCSRPPLVHSMSDEVFLPAENKLRLWDVVRSTAKSSLKTSCDVEDDRSRAATVVEPTPQTALETSNVPHSTGENEETKVVTGQCHSSRLSRLTRQISIHEENQREKSSSEQQQPRVRIKLDSMKAVPNKDSFELEELPTGGDFQDDDWQGTTDRKGLQTDSTDIPRTGSAMSDSSGFLDGETLETVMDIIDEVSTQVTSTIDTPIKALETEECERDDTSTITNIVASEITKDRVVLDTRATLPSREMKEVIENDHERVESAEESETNVQIFNYDHVGSTGYLSESDTIVAIESSSSGDNQDTSIIKEKPVVVYEQSDIVRKTWKTSTYFDKCLRHHHHHHHHPLDTKTTTNLAKSRSEANLNVVYKSPTNDRRMDTFSSWTSLVNIPSSKIGGPQFASSSTRVSGLSDCNLHYSWNRSLENPYTTQEIPRHSRDISTFHESCTLAIERMRDVLKVYTKQLKDMERSCWETHNRFFPGTTKYERDELNKLSDLRRHILEEVNRAQLLLCKKTEEPRQEHHLVGLQCNPYLIKITNQLEVLIKCQRELSNHFAALQSTYRTTRHEPTPSSSEQPSQVKQMFDQMKLEILQEVKTILRNDHLRFQEELQRTRSGIEEVRQTVNQLLSIVQSMKTS